MENCVQRSKGGIADVVGSLPLFEEGGREVKASEDYKEFSLFLRLRFSLL
jgi:hypothetical protein